MEYDENIYIKFSNKKGGNIEYAHPTVGHARSTRQMLTFPYVVLIYITCIVQSSTLNYQCE